ncbi:MAG: 1-deoxy-D-xylulose-5-phosphate synthase N-terminal domain-containing protein, partial [Rectinemataceae bacterium]
MHACQVREHSFIYRRGRHALPVPQHGMEVEQFHSDFHACIVQINGKRHKTTPLPCPRLEKALRSVLYWLDMSLLEQIQGPRDLDRLSLRDLVRLSREIRRRIAEVVPRNGGHYASNLGVVELTI